METILLFFSSGQSAQPGRSSPSPVPSELIGPAPRDGINLRSGAAERAGSAPHAREDAMAISCQCHANMPCHAMAPPLPDSRAWLAPGSIWCSGGRKCPRCPSRASVITWPERRHGRWSLEDSSVPFSSPAGGAACTWRRRGARTGRGGLRRRLVFFFTGLIRVGAGAVLNCPCRL